MQPLRPIANILARSKAGRRALSGKVDISYFLRRPSAQIVLGLFLIGVSYTVGWPFISACGVVAIWLREPLIAVIGGPFCYALSWSIFLIAMAIIGKESAPHMPMLGKWAIRRFILRFASPKYYGDISEGRSSSANSSNSNSSK